MSAQDNEVYRDLMDSPVEELAVAIWGVSSGVSPMDDHEIVSRAAGKVKMLKEMLLATGMSPALLKACLEN
jgi:hypothetical protein